MTGEEANDKSMERAHTSTIRMTTLALFLVFSLLVFSVILQRQQAELARLVKENVDSLHVMCLQRAANATKTNTNWDELAEIERRNTFINEDIRKARLKVYRDAHLIIPICD